MEKKLFRFSVAQQVTVYRDILIRAESAENAVDQYKNVFDADFDVENEEIVDNGYDNVELVSDVVLVEEEEEA